MDCYFSLYYAIPYNEAKICVVCRTVFNGMCCPRENHHGYILLSDLFSSDLLSSEWILQNKK
jgi:hypothetical protein